MTGVRDGATYNLKRMAYDMRREQLDEEERVIATELEASRPRFRSDCADGQRPCPYMACRHHLYLEVTEAGSIRLPFPELDLDELADTCSLDVADRGGVILDQIGSILAVSRERVRQVEEAALERYREALRGLA